jgi:hypothetical protein
VFGSCFPYQYTHIALLVNMLMSSLPLHAVQESPVLRTRELLLQGGIMYSPTISPVLIPRLYRLAKALKVPMTRLVNQLLEHGMAQSGGRASVSSQFFSSAQLPQSVSAALIAPGRPRRLAAQAG